MLSQFAFILKIKIKQAFPHLVHIGFPFSWALHSNLGRTLQSIHKKLWLRRIQGGGQALPPLFNFPRCILYKNENPIQNCALLIQFPYRRRRPCINLRMRKKQALAKTRCTPHLFLPYALPRRKQCILYEFVLFIGFWQCFAGVLQNVSGPLLIFLDVFYTKMIILYRIVHYWFNFLIAEFILRRKIKQAFPHLVHIWFSFSLSQP